ncbi:hypothetical protein LY78DRAFT_332453 [Colletotrichum sublineola]|nr:hypothetical protein LY78DRAFT_332453 [Colletotrichum sublineola]
MRARAAASFLTAAAIAIAARLASSSLAISCCNLCVCSVISASVTRMITESTDSTSESSLDSGDAYARRCRFVELGCSDTTAALDLVLFLDTVDGGVFGGGWIVREACVKGEAL